MSYELLLAALGASVCLVGTAAWWFVKRERRRPPPDPEWEDPDMEFFMDDKL